MEIRHYRAGDEADILQLFELCFGKPMPSDYWRWRYLDNPLKEIMIELMWQGARLVGHYAVSPVQLSVGGNSIKTALSMGTMTHPDFGGQGIFTKLAKATYDEMASRDYAAVWGFPNSASHYGFVNKLAWQNIYQVPTLRLQVDHCRLTEVPQDRVHQLDVFDDRCDRLWQSTAPQLQCAVVRSQNYLQWRYLDNPSQQYGVLAAEGKTGSNGGEEKDLEGYAVYKSYHDGTTPCLDIVDLLAAPEALTSLLLSLVSKAKALGAQTILTWVNVFSPMYPVLERAGFVPDGPVTYLGGRLLGDNQQSELLEYKNWFLTMGDSDVY